MQKKKNKIIQITLLIILIGLIWGIFILYIHNVLPYINLKIFFLLLKNNINIFTLYIDYHEFHPRYISSGDFNFLVEQLLDPESFI